MIHSGLSRSSRFIVGALAFVLCGGCNKDVKNPTYEPDTTGVNDTTGNGDTTGTGSYGTLYFRSDAATQWDTLGPVRWSNSALIAFNPNYPPADTLTAAAWLADSIDFGDSRTLTFTWQSGGDNEATYKFLIGYPPDHWQEVPYHTNAQDWEVAQVSILLDPGGVYLRYEFTLPPRGQMRVTNIKGYGL